LLIIIIEETERIQKEHNLENQNKYKDKILATVSHDIKGPLNSIVNCSLSLLGDLSEKEI
jgi:signal transduction histidine kinase